MGEQISALPSRSGLRPLTAGCAESLHLCHSQAFLIWRPCPVADVVTVFGVEPWGGGDMQVPSAQGRYRAPVHDILNGLPSAHLSQLMKTADPKRLLRGRVLFREGEAGDSCYWIVDGTVKVSVDSAQGEEQIFALLGPGSVIGELTILDKLPRSATVTAITDVSLTALTRDKLMTYLNAHPSVYSDLVAILVGRLRKADEELTADTFLTVQGRVARAILSLVDQVGEPSKSGVLVLPTTISHRDIGAMAGVARESVSRALSEWRRRGIVTREAGRKLGVQKLKLQTEAR